MPPLDESKLVSISIRVHNSLSSGASQVRRDESPDDKNDACLRCQRLAGLITDLEAMLLHLHEVDLKRQGFQEQSFALQGQVQRLMSAAAAASTALGDSGSHAGHVAGVPVVVEGVDAGAAQEPASSSSMMTPLLSPSRRTVRSRSSSKSRFALLLEGGGDKGAMMTVASSSSSLEEENGALQAPSRPATNSVTLQASAADPGVESETSASRTVAYPTEAADSAGSTTASEGHAESVVVARANETVGSMIDVGSPIFSVISNGSSAASRSSRSNLGPAGGSTAEGGSSLGGRLSSMAVALSSGDKAAVPSQRVISRRKSLNRVRRSMSFLGLVRVKLPLPPNELLPETADHSLPFSPIVKLHFRVKEADTPQNATPGLARVSVILSVTADSMSESAPPLPLTSSRRGSMDIQRDAITGRLIRPHVDGVEDSRPPLLVVGGGDGGGGGASVLHGSVLNPSVSSPSINPSIGGAELGTATNDSFNMWGNATRSRGGVGEASRGAGGGIGGVANGSLAGLIEALSSSQSALRVASRSWHGAETLGLGDDHGGGAADGEEAQGGRGGANLSRRGSSSSGSSTEDLEEALGLMPHRGASGGGASPSAGGKTTGRAGAARRSKEDKSRPKSRSSFVFVPVVPGTSPTPTPKDANRGAPSDSQPAAAGSASPPSGADAPLGDGEPSPSPTPCLPGSPLIQRSQSGRSADPEAALETVPEDDEIDGKVLVGVVGSVKSVGYECETPGDCCTWGLLASLFHSALTPAFET